VTVGETALRSLGAFLGGAWIAYGLGLALLTLFGGHTIVLASLVYVVVRRKRERIFRLACETVYGLLNPIMYLVVLRPGLIAYESAFWQKLPLQSAACLMLTLVWSARFAGSALSHRRGFDAARRLLLWAALLCLLVFAIKDGLLLATLEQPGRGAPLSPTGILFGGAILSGLVSLYLIPGVLLVDYLRAFLDRPPQGSDFLLLHESVARRVGFAIAGLALVSLVVATWRTGDAATRRLVNAQRTAIIDAGREFNVDPAVIAAIMYVTHRYQISPFRDKTERVAMAAWLKDPQNDFFLGRSLNISIGLAQIKPVTAQTAVVILSRKPTWFSKEYREVPVLDWSLAGENLPYRRTSWLGDGKAAVVSALLDDRGNIDTCALILAVYQLQWRAKGIDIRNRPDILGTLFQIGFERSHPHPSPQNNAFGRRVQQVHDTAWLQEAFR
jgi:hypothetical protein